MARTAAPILLSPGYTQAATEVALEQAAKAAVRTAAELNRVLGSGPRQNITSWFYPSRKPNPPLADPSPKAEASPPQTAPATALAGSTRVTRSTVYLIGAGLALVLFVPIVLFTRTTRRRDIFVSYRRKTSEGHVGRLCDRLEAVFGAEHVFRDVNSIQGGSDFVETIEQRLATCDVVLAVIGPSWARDPRLKDSGDFVRRELCGALSAGVPVIPVLVQDAVPLEPAELPDDLQPLCRRQAIRVPDDNLFDASMTSLIRAIRKTPRRSSARPASQNNAVPSNR
jgi:hypothetical protein